MDCVENTKKRKREEDDDLPRAKIPCIVVEDEKPSTSSGYAAKSITYTTGLMDLSDEIWLAIFSQLDSETIYSLAKCCSRLRSFTEEKTLWIHADFKRKPLQAQQILKRLKFLTPDTKSLSLRGMYSYYPLDKYKNVTITQNMLNNLRDNCPQLENLEIFEGFIDIEKISIQNFPESLKTLTFKKCSTKINARIDSSKSPFFSKIDKQLQLLEELTLEECHFFDTHDLMSFSKIINLKKLSLKGCTSLKDCVPYGSIATRFGFRKLEVLDIRDTPVSDSDIQSFNMTKTLKELLMECPTGYRDDAISAGDTTATPSTSRRFSRRASAEPEVGGHVNGNAEQEPAPAAPPEQQPEENDNETSTDDESGNEMENDNMQVPLVVEPNAVEPSNNRQPHNVQIIIDGVQQMPENVNADGAVVANGNGNPPDERRIVNEEIVDDDAQERRSRLDMLRARAHAIGPNINIRDDIRNHFMQMDPQNIIHVVIHENPNLIRAGELQRRNPNDAAGAADEGGGAHNPVDRHDIMFNPGGEYDPVERAIDRARRVAQVIRDRAADDEVRNMDNGQEEVIMHRPNHIIFVRRNNDGVAVNDDLLRPIPNLQNRYAPIAGYLRLDNNQPYYQFDPPTKPLISDRGICSFGMSRNNIQQGVIWIRAEHRQPDTNLERLVVRFYKLVTDVSLRHLSFCAPKLKYLDVTGTSVTEIGIEQFKITKPECIIASNYSPNTT